MSLKTWKEEFYSEPTEKMTKKEAIEHSIKKWIGLRERNLAKHDCRIYLDQIRDFSTDKFLTVDSHSCALCVKYLDIVSDLDACHKCPLYKNLDNERCDKYYKSPYCVWITALNPEPMIKALRKLLK